MPTESQNIEFKESWRDEYQKWICGFANAQGGTLYIGLRDNGEVCGVRDAKKLMEDIPNKVRDMMGILVDVNLKEKDGKSYLEIVTEAYTYPVSFRGKYYQLSGATNQGLPKVRKNRQMSHRSISTVIVSTYGQARSFLFWSVWMSCAVFPFGATSSFGNPNGSMRTMP